MTIATIINRMSKMVKAEAVTAAIVLENELVGYTIDGNKIIENESGDFYGMVYYRNGEEVIAVADFYLGEDGITFWGSKGGKYTLNGETLVAA